MIDYTGCTDPGTGTVVGTLSILHSTKFIQYCTCSMNSIVIIWCSFYVGSGISRYYHKKLSFIDLFECSKIIMCLNFWFISTVNKHLIIYRSITRVQDMNKLCQSCMGGLTKKRVPCRRRHHHHHRTRVRRHHRHRQLLRSQPEPQL